MYQSPFPVGNFGVIRYGNGKGMLSDDDIDRLSEGELQSLKPMTMEHTPNCHFSTGLGEVLVKNITVIMTTKYLLLHTKHNNLVVMRRSDGVIVCMPPELSQTEQMQASSILMGVSTRSNTPSILGAMSRSMASQYSHATVPVYVFMAMVVAVGAYAVGVHINACFDMLRQVDTGHLQALNDLLGQTTDLKKSVKFLDEGLATTNADIARLGTRLSKLEHDAAGKPLPIGTGAETKKPLSIGTGAETKKPPSAGNATKGNELSVYAPPNQTSWFNSWNMVALFVVFCMTGTFITHCLALMD
jgi:hypothetical protein